MTCSPGEDVARCRAFPRANRRWVPTGVTEYVIQEQSQAGSVALWDLLSALHSKQGCWAPQHLLAHQRRLKKVDRPCNLLSLPSVSRTVITCCLRFCAQLPLWLGHFIDWDERESYLWDSEECVSPVHGLLTMQHTCTELFPCWRRLLVSK